MKALIATSLGNIKVDNFEVPNKGNNILVKTELASICEKYNSYRAGCGKKSFKGITCRKIKHKHTKKNHPHI